MTMRRLPLNEDIAIADPALAQQYSNAQSQLINKDKQIAALQTQIQKLNTEKIEIEKAKGAIEQKAAQGQAAAQKQSVEQQKQQAAKVAADAAAGKPTAPSVPATTIQNSSAISILKRVDVDISEDADLPGEKVRVSPLHKSWSQHANMSNWYQRDDPGGHKPERAPRKKMMDYKRRMKIQDMEDEIADLKSDLESTMSDYKSPDFEGAEGEVENFFGEIGFEASEILNSGAYKTDKEKIKALKAAGVAQPEETLGNYYYYYPEFDQSKEKGRKKAEKEAEKIQAKIDKIQAKIDKWEEVYESRVNEGHEIRASKLEDQIVKNIDYSDGYFVLNMEDGTSVSIGCCGGAWLDISGEPENIQYNKIIRIEHDDMYSIKFIFDNKEIIYVEDGTGGEGLELWQNDVYESLNEELEFMGHLSGQAYEDRLNQIYSKLEDELAELMNNGGSSEEIEDIKDQLREINYEFRDMEDRQIAREAMEREEQEEQEREEQERYQEEYEREQDERYREQEFYGSNPQEGEYESVNPASSENFYVLNEAYVETDQEKKTPEGYAEKDYVFYVRITEDGEEFVGKIFKDSPDEDWYGLVKIGESSTFEKMSYQPEYNEADIVDFLAGTYEEVEIIDEEEFTELFIESDKDFKDEDVIGD
jgi:hypothetical protein